MFFLTETKESMSSMHLRLIEKLMIHCAGEHFKVISGDNVVYDDLDGYMTCWSLPVDRE